MGLFGKSEDKKAQEAAKSQDQKDKEKKDRRRRARNALIIFGAGR